MQAGNEISVFAEFAWGFAIVDPLALSGEDAGPGLTLSPMPGLVKAVLVAPGRR